ncbi:MAG: glutamate synthase subunit beta [Dysosmobacter welbionis]
MGKPTGFLEYTRREDGRRPAAERVRDWEEFHLPLPEEIRRQQGARCMNCGVPFCQAGMIYEGKAFGCPLHNLIPEWNDMILSGNWGHALSRLLKANSFPEFTGRVCPAPCENACICGIYGDPITVRDNELSIIEAAFGAGKLRPRRPPQWSGKKVCVVGSGPAGLAAADQLNRRGHMVTVIERAEHPGGLLMYGIPNMKLPKSVVRRRIDLMTEEGVTFVCGVDASEGAVAKRLLAEYDAVILCCGAGAPRPLGLDTTGISGALRHRVPEGCCGAGSVRQGGGGGSLRLRAGSVVIIGTGDTASDCVATALRQGCRSVTQLVRRPRTDYLDAAGSLPLDYAHEEALAVTGQDPRRFGVRVRAWWRGKRFPDRCGHHGGGYPALPAVDRRHRLCRV